MKAEFYFDCHKYICSLVQVDFVKELKIKNHQGFVLAVKQGEKIGLLGKSRHDAKQVDVSKSHFYNVIKAAMSALELETKNEVILERNRTIADAEDLIQQQNREIRVLNEQIRMLATKVEELSREKQQLSMQLVEKQIRETEISQEIDDFPASEEDLVSAEIKNGIGEAEISQEIAQLSVQNPGLDVQLIENPRDFKGSEEEEEMTESDVKSVDLEIREEVEFPGGETEIKRLPKRGAQKRMRKK
jgi:TolA-binding protein